MEKWVWIATPNGWIVGEVITEEVNHTVISLKLSSPIGHLPYVREQATAPGPVAKQ